jgi:hypothetical protein
MWKQRNEEKVAVRIKIGRVRDMEPAWVLTNDGLSGEERPFEQLHDWRPMQEGETARPEVDSEARLSA